MAHPTLLGCFAAPAPGRRSNARLEPLFDRFITVQVAVGLRFPQVVGPKATTLPSLFLKPT